MGDRDTIEELRARIETLEATAESRIESARSAWEAEKRGLEARHARELEMARMTAEMEHRMRETETVQKLAMKEAELSQGRMVAAVEAEAARTALVAPVAGASAKIAVLDARCGQLEAEVEVLLGLSRYEIRSLYKTREATLVREVEDTERRLRETGGVDAPDRTRESMARVMGGIIEQKRADLAETRRKLDRVGR